MVKKYKSFKLKKSKTKNKSKILKIKTKILKYTQKINKNIKIMKGGLVSPLVKLINEYIKNKYFTTDIDENKDIDIDTDKNNYDWEYYETNNGLIKLDAYYFTHKITKQKLLFIIGFFRIDDSYIEYLKNTKKTINKGLGLEYIDKLLFEYDYIFIIDSENNKFYEKFIQIPVISSYKNFFQGIDFCLLGDRILLKLLKNKNIQKIIHENKNEKKNNYNLTFTRYWNLIDK